MVKKNLNGHLFLLPVLLQMKEKTYIGIDQQSGYGSGNS